MSRLDAYYTPPSIVTRMLDSVEARDQWCAIDVAAGAGDLLEAWQLRAPHSAIIAMDINRNCVSRLRRRYPSWQVANCDFLSEKSRQRISLLRELRGRVPLALLNPPFSARGSAYRLVNWGGKQVKCSPAMAFVLLLFDYLMLNGELVTVLPLGCLRSNRDREAWNIINKVSRVTVVNNNGYKSFAATSARTVVVHLKKGMATASKAIGAKRTADTNNHRAIVTLRRGRTPVFRVQRVGAARSLPYIHTTDLHSGTVLLNGRRAEKRNGEIIRGPAVLLPRVGNPSQSKVCLYLSTRRVILSDCVFGIECAGVRQAKSLKAAICREWTDIASCYGGTCASYITVRDLVCALSRLGLMVHLGRLQEYFQRLES